MLFRTKSGKIVEINLFDSNNDFNYYNKILALKKDFLQNDSTVTKDVAVGVAGSISSFLHKSSKVNTLMLQPSDDPHSQ
jgi:hypothetical protein